MDFGYKTEYAENQVGTTIVYADSPSSSFPHPYVYFSDGRTTRIVPLSPSSMGLPLHQVEDEDDAPTICNNVITRNNNNDHVQLQLPTSSGERQGVSS